MRNPPAEAAELNEIGNIDTPSGPAPALAGNRNWLRNGVTRTQDGKAFRLESWMVLSRDWFAFLRRYTVMSGSFQRSS
ncbi:MAG: hypothetical protein NTW21_44630 [Verrucomicrobia bacterium]|nr:hypothetical protein [Verrucomicrobiota bacterium]